MRLERGWNGRRITILGKTNADPVGVGKWNISATLLALPMLQIGRTCNKSWPEDRRR